MCYVEKGHSPEHDVTQCAFTRLATVLLCAQAHTHSQFRLNYMS